MNITGATLLMDETTATLVCTLLEATRLTAVEAYGVIDAGTVALGITTGSPASDEAITAAGDAVKLDAAAGVVAGAKVFKTPTPSVGRGNGLPLTSQTPAVNAGQGGGVFEGA